MKNNSDDKKTKINLEARRATKMIFLVFTLTLFTLSFTSAFEFDNVKSYDTETRTATITNAFGLGETIAEVKLITPQIYNVIEGKNRKVMIFETNNFGDIYENGLKELEILNLNNENKKEVKSYYYEYAIYENVLVNDYENICVNVSKDYEKCYGEKIGEHYENKITGWNKLEGEDIPIGKLTIAVVTDVNKKDHYDGIPNLFGIKIDEWAEWTASYNNGLLMVLHLDEASGTVIDSVAGVYNYTNDGASVLSNGVSGTAYDFDDDADTLTSAVVLPITNDFTFALWINKSDSGANSVMVAASENNGQDFLVNTNNKLVLQKPGVGSVESDLLVFQDEYTFVAVTYNGTGIQFYVNGSTNFKASTQNYEAKARVVGRAFGGGDGVSSQMDEIMIWNRSLTPTEIGNLYDNGIGTFFAEQVSSTISVTLNSPENYTSTLNTSLVFNSNSTCSECNFTNTTLNIWYSNGSLFNTNYTTINGETNSTNRSISGLAIADLYNWNQEWCGNNGTEENYNCTFQSTNWTFSVKSALENSTTFNATSVELSTEGIVLNISYDNTVYSVVTGKLFYNSTWYTGTVSTSGGEAILKRTITTPQVSSTTKVPFNWEVSLTSESGTDKFNSSNQNQSVSPIVMQLCDNDQFNYTFINFTTQDELTLTDLNSTFEATFQFKPIGATITENYTYSDTSGGNFTWSFCFTPTDKSYELDAIIELAAPNYVTKFYNYDDLALTNTTTNITLYMLESGNSTSFIILVRDSGYDPIENALVYVQRLNTGTNEWLTTETVLTNYEGKTIGHLLSEDADYRFLVYIGGTLEYTSASTKITCEATPCTVTLTLPGTTNVDFDEFESPDDFTSTLTWDSTNFIFTYTYSDAASTFTNARLHVIRLAVGNATIPSPSCNETKTTASGVITCDISATTNINGTYMATGFLTRTTEANKVVQRILRSKISSIVNTIGLDGVLWSFFLFIGIITLGFYRPSLGIISAVVGVVFLWLIGLMEITVTAVVAIVAIAIVLLWEIGRQ